MFCVSILLSTVTLLFCLTTLRIYQQMIFFVTGVLNASDLSLMEYFMNLKEENTVSMISMFYLHHAVENAVSAKQIYWICLIVLKENEPRNNNFPNLLTGEFIIGRVIKAMMSTWHPQCFTCEMCHKELADLGFIKNQGKATNVFIRVVLSITINFVFCDINPFSI